MSLISRAEFARLAGVSPAAITKACKRQLSQASDGLRIDADHPRAREYLAARAHAPTAAAARDAANAKRAADAELDELADLALKVLERLILRARRGRRRAAEGLELPEVQE